MERKVLLLLHKGQPAAALETEETLRRGGIQDALVLEQVSDPSHRLAARRPLPAAGRLREKAARSRAEIRPARVLDYGAALAREHEAREDAPDLGAFDLVEGIAIAHVDHAVVLEEPVES